MEIMCKNDLSFVKDIPMIYLKLITIMLIMSEESGRHYIHYQF